MRSHKDYTIGWICALPLERTAAKAILDETHAELPNPHTDNNTYTLGRIHGHNVVIACLPAGVYGTTSATAVISHLRSTFPNVRYGLMVGIGGGVPSNDNDIRLGDVVVSHPSGTVGGVVQYDLGKTVSGGDSQRTGMLNQPHTILLTAIARLRSDRMMENSSKISETVVRILDKHLDMRSEFSKPDELYDRLFLPAYDHPDLEKTCAGCDLKQLIQRKPRTSTEPQVHYGVIASGNQVIKDGQSRDRIAKETNALCFEIEAAGIMNHLPCLVVRGICDYCDSHKNKGWQGYAALTAAAFSKELLSVVPVSVTGEINRGILETKEAKDCLRDLFLTDPVEDKNALKRRKGDRASGTCSWMLDTIELKTWLGDIQQSSNDPGILWLHGLPGTGKSTMAITLVEELSKTPSFASGQKLLAYFFCESSSGNRTTVTGVLRGILYHLVIQRPELLRFILPKYNDRKATLFSSFDSLWGVLMDIVNDPATGTKYIIIDALDECDTESQKTLLKQFRQSFRDSTSGYSAPHVRILVTSRPYQEIREDLEQFNNKDLGSFDKSKRDVELFISERVAQFRARKKYTKKIADEVTRILKEKAGGTFLWIGIACDELDEKQSKDAIRYLQGLPSGLYSLYQRLLDRCVQSNPDEAKIKRLLSVIAVSRRPLSVSELSLVCELYIDEEEEERLIFTRDEIHSCRLLVVIQDDQVQLLHKSTKDFLHRHFISETKAHAMLAYRCVDRLIQYADANLKVNYGDVMKDSFLRYSVFFWMEHVRLAMTDFAVVPSQVDFFSVNSKGMESWLELYRRSSRKPVPQEGTIFHVAAAWNILPLIHHAIPMKGHDRQTKIYHDNVFKDKSGRTPLEIAAFFGHTDILSALLERLNENAVINEEVVIAAAQSRGSKEPMKLLLEQRGDQIPITEEVVKAAVSNSAHGKDIITFLLEQRGDQILVTEEMIKAAVSNAICGKEIMMFLFEQRGDQIPITEEVVKAAVRTKEDGPSVVNNNRDIEIIAFLIEQRGDQILITEEIVKDALRNPGAMAVLLEKRGDQIFITEKLFKAVLRTSGFMGVPPEQRGDLIPTIEETEETWSWYASEGIEIMEMLLGRGFIDNFITPDLVKLAIRFCPVELVKLLLHKLGKYFSITTEVMVAATRNEWHNEEMLALLLAHQLDPNFVIEDVLEEATYHKHNALHMMALLLDQANGQIAIAEQLVVAIATNGWESRNQLMLLLLTERYNYDLVLVTPAKVVELGARFFNAEVMTLLLDRLGGRVIITENLLMAVEQNKNGGDELKKILVSLTDQRREHNNNLSVTFLPSFYTGNQLATGSMDGSIIIYDTLSFTIIHLLCAHGEHKPNEWVIAISWSPDDKRLVSCYWNGTIRMWNVITGDLEFHCYHRKATAAIFSIDGKTFISSSENRSQLHQWSDSGELLYSWPEDFPAVAWSLTPDGTQLITGDYSRRRIHVYDFQNHEKKLSLEFRERLTCVTVSDDARYILVRFSSGEVQLIHLAERRLIRRFRGPQPESFMHGRHHLGTDGRLVVSGSEDSRIYIWDRDSGRILDILEGHTTGCVNSISFNHAYPDIFASAGDDCTVRIWRKSRVFGKRRHS